MENADIAKRMYYSAMEYLWGAKCLTKKFDSRSGAGASLLGTLSLEILLKCVHFVDRGDQKRSHNYRHIWNALTEKTKIAILTSARERFPGRTDLSKLDTQLKAWQRAFEKARYPYEVNANRSDEEITALEQEWAAAGYNPEDADVAFYPLERTALIYGLRQWIENQLGVQSDIPI